MLSINDTLALNEFAKRIRKTNRSFHLCEDRGCHLIAISNHVHNYSNHYNNTHCFLHADKNNYCHLCGVSSILHRERVYYQLWNGCFIVCSECARLFPFTIHNIPNEEMLRKIAVYGKKHHPSIKIWVSENSDGMYFLSDELFQKACCSQDEKCSRWCDHLNGSFLRNRDTFGNWYCSAHRYENVDAKNQEPLLSKEMLIQRYSNHEWKYEQATSEWKCLLPRLPSFPSGWTYEQHKTDHPHCEKCCRSRTHIVPYWNLGSYSFKDNPRSFNKFYSRPRLSNNQKLNDKCIECAHVWPCANCDKYFIPQAKRIECSNCTRRIDKGCSDLQEYIKHVFPNLLLPELWQIILMYLPCSMFLCSLCQKVCCTYCVCPIYRCELCNTRLPFRCMNCAFGQFHEEVTEDEPELVMIKRFKRNEQGHYSLHAEHRSILTHCQNCLKNSLRE